MLKGFDIVLVLMPFSSFFSDLDQITPEAVVLIFFGGVCFSLLIIFEIWLKITGQTHKDVYQKVKTYRERKENERKTVRFSFHECEAWEKALKDSVFDDTYAAQYEHKSSQNLDDTVGDYDFDNPNNSDEFRPAQGKNDDDGYTVMTSPINFKDMYHSMHEPSRMPAKMVENLSVVPTLQANRNQQSGKTYSNICVYACYDH